VNDAWAVSEGAIFGSPVGLSDFESEEDSENSRFSLISPAWPGTGSFVKSNPDEMLSLSPQRRERKRQEEAKP
jgi:hypothetical protein